MVGRAGAELWEIHTENGSGHRTCAETPRNSTSISNEQLGKPHKNPHPVNAHGKHQYTAGYKGC